MVSVASGASGRPGLGFSVGLAPSSRPLSLQEESMLRRSCSPCGTWESRYLNNRQKKFSRGECLASLFTWFNEIHCDKRKVLELTLWRHSLH